MRNCEIRVVSPEGRDVTALTETFTRLGYPVAEDGEIVVVDARQSGSAEWADLERSLTDRNAPTVVISDDHSAEVVSFAQRLGQRVVFASGGSEIGYAVAVKLCALLLDEQETEVAA